MSGTGAKANSLRGEGVSVKISSTYDDIHFQVLSFHDTDDTAAPGNGCVNHPFGYSATPGTEELSWRLRHRGGTGS